MTDGPNRDRDPAGRPLNARPRDELGRPLPRGAAGVEPLPEVIDLPPGQTLALARRLLDEGRPFQAHEVLESAWKPAPPAERDLWQGLAQIAVEVTHAKSGNTEGGFKGSKQEAVAVFIRSALPRERQKLKLVIVTENNRPKY